MESLTINVASGDVALFLRLFSKYRENQESVTDMLKHQLSSTHKSAKYTLYDGVIRKCTCGMCYSSFARNDRIPWRFNTAPGSYTNAKHGDYQVPENCSLYTSKFTGYIYVAEQEFQDIRREKKRRANADSLVRKRKIDELERAREKAEKQRLDRLNAIKRAQDVVKSATRTIEVHTIEQKAREKHAKDVKEYADKANHFMWKWQEGNGGSLNGITFKMDSEKTMDENISKWVDIYEKNFPLPKRITLNYPLANLKDSQLTDALSNAESELAKANFSLKSLTKSN
jgi:hypothetical protein